MRQLFVILPMLGLAACAGNGSGGSAVPANLLSPTPSVGTNPVSTPVSNPSVDPTPSPTPVSNPTGSSLNITVYSLTKTVAPVNGWILKTYTATGYCLNRNSKNYCWDDGMKTIPSWIDNNFQYGPYYNDYWETYLTNQSMVGFNCKNGCTTDPTTSPTYFDITYTVNIGTSKINEVFNSGTATVLSCTTDGVTVTCPNFTFPDN
jgi:hypothetical protein